MNVITFLTVSFNKNFYFLIFFLAAEATETKGERI